ncbi:MAG TPA: dephospho-CoA kinase [Candidatus Aminicenantes bacterium]|nr:dephospho-CoA kinase [Candidatus Aminicenantes bacterium]
MHLIGLTGGIATGKSFVLEVLAELGCCTVRADQLAREILDAPDFPHLDRLAEALGPSVLDEQGRLVRPEFARILFADPQKRHFVDSLVHPLVVAARDRKIAEARELGLYDFFVYESALLIEAGTYRDFERIVVVYAPQAIQRERLMARDHLTAEETEKRIQAQFPLREKLKVADYAIDTGGSFDQVRGRTCEVFHLLRQDFDLMGGL